PSSPSARTGEPSSEVAQAAVGARSWHRLGRRRWPGRGAQPRDGGKVHPIGSKSRLPATETPLPALPPWPGLCRHLLEMPPSSPPSGHWSWPSGPGCSRSCPNCCSNCPSPAWGSDLPRRRAVGKEDALRDPSRGEQAQAVGVGLADDAEVPVAPGQLLERP